MKSVLVVCEGNICRSPMAAALLRTKLPGVTVASAGLGALLGHPADPAAVELMREREIDISGHRAAQITRQACVGSDLVLVMDREQRKRLQALYPEVHGRVFRVGDPIDRDVPDPYRQPMAAFRSALALMDEGIDYWLRRMARL